MNANTHTKQQLKEDILKEIFKHGEEALYKTLYKLVIGDAGFALEVIGYFLANASGDSRVPELRTRPVDPAYSKLSYGELQERLGQYIVALNAVQRMPTTPGVLHARQVLSTQICKMKALVNPFNQ